MTRRTLAALLSTALCVSVGACDGLADLFGRLSVDTVSTREGAGFVGPSLLRLDAGNARLAPACARSPALGPRLAGQFGRDVAGTGPLSSFWAQVEARGRVRSAVSSIVMSGKNRARGNRVIVKDVPSKDKPSAGLSGIVQRVSHQVLVLNASYEPLSVVSAHRALALLFSEKASTVVNKATWVSAGGQSFDVPSVVSLRRYVKVTNRMPPLNRKTILMRDNGVCQYCDAPADNIDHVIPRSKGGESLAAYVLCATSPILRLFDCALFLHTPTLSFSCFGTLLTRHCPGGNSWENCVACCKHCNSKKGASYLKDMPGMKLKRQPGRPSKLSWVHAAVWKVDKSWKPFVGEVSWEDIEKKVFHIVVCTITYLQAWMLVSAHTNVPHARKGQRQEQEGWQEEGQSWQESQGQGCWRGRGACTHSERRGASA